MTAADELIRRCVRGLEPWQSLDSIGITIRRTGDQWTFSNPAHHVAVVHPNDVAEGLTRLHADPERLREWAEILLSASAFVDLRLENHPYGEALLEGLWEASAGESVREAAFLAARELYARQDGASGEA